MLAARGPSDGQGGERSWRMARRQLLISEALARHYNPPTDEREIGRHFTLSREDLDLVGERRGASSRLGFAMMLLYMRWPGRVLEAGEKPPGAILAFVADQIDVPATAFDNYARRDETRCAHLADLMQRFGYAAFDRNHFRAIVAFAMPVAQTVAQSLQFAGTVIDELRRRRVLLPPQRSSRWSSGVRANRPSNSPMKS